MKKNGFSFIIIFLFTFTVLGQNSQEEEKNRHSFIHQFNNIAFNKINKGENISHYRSNIRQSNLKKYKDDKKKKLDSIIFVRTNGNGYGSIFNYNSDGYLTIETFIEKEDSNKWDTQNKYEYTYDTEERVIFKILYSWNQNDNQWSSAKYKEEYIYNTQGNLAIMYRYDADMNNFYDKYEYSYNAEEQLISITEFMGNNNNIETRFEYAYNTQGYVTSIDEFDWNSSTNQLEIKKKYEYTYDTNGNMTQESILSQNIDNQWIETNKLEYIYDTNGNAILFFEYYGNPLELSNKQEYSINTEYSSSDLMMPPNWMDDYVEDNRLNGWNYPNNMMTHFLSYKYVDQNWEESGETTLYYSDVSTSNIICENLSITNATYPETDDLNQRIKEEFGESYAIADWNDLKNITNLDDWISCINLKHDDTFLITRDGNKIYSGNRQYLVHYSTDGLPYSGFLVHDKVGDFYLGSWYGLNMRILAKNNGALAIGDFNQANSFNIYPNPVSNIFSIDSKSQIKKVEFYSVLGQKIKEVTKNFNSIPLDDLSNGIYLVRIESENGIAVKKLIKQ